MQPRSPAPLLALSFALFALVVPGAAAIAEERVEQEANLLFERDGGTAGIAAADWYVSFSDLYASESGLSSSPPRGDDDHASSKSSRSSPPPSNASFSFWSSISWILSVAAWPVLVSAAHSDLLGTPWASLDKLAGLENGNDFFLVTCAANAFSLLPQHPSPIFLILRLAADVTTLVVAPLAAWRPVRAVSNPFSVSCLTILVLLACLGSIMLEAFSRLMDVHAVIGWRRVGAGLLVFVASLAGTCVGLHGCAGAAARLLAGGWGRGRARDELGSVAMRLVVAFLGFWCAAVGGPWLVGKSGTAVVAAAFGAQAALVAHCGVEWSMGVGNGATWDGEAEAGFVDTLSCETVVSSSSGNLIFFAFVRCVMLGLVGQSDDPSPAEARGRCALELFSLAAGAAGGLRFLYHACFHDRLKELARRRRLGRWRACAGGCVAIVPLLLQLALLVERAVSALTPAGRAALAADPPSLVRLVACLGLVSDWFLRRAANGACDTLVVLQATAVHTMRRVQGRGRCEAFCRLDYDYEYNLVRRHRIPRTRGAATAAASPLLATDLPRAHRPRSQASVFLVVAATWPTPETLTTGIFCLDACVLGHYHAKFGSPYVTLPVLFAWVLASAAPWGAFGLTDPFGWTLARMVPVAALAVGSVKTALLARHAIYWQGQVAQGARPNPYERTGLEDGAPAGWWAVNPPPPLARLRRTGRPPPPMIMRELRALAGFETTRALALTLGLAFAVGAQPSATPPFSPRGLRR